MQLKKNISKFLSKKLYLINHALILCKLGSKGNKSKFILLIIFLLITGLTETLPVLLVIPFITIIGYPEKAFDIPKFREISVFLNISNPEELLLPCLIIFVFFVSINAYLRIQIIDFIFFVKASIANTLSNSAFERILLSTYEFQIGTNSSSIINDFNNSMGCSIGYIETFLNMMRDLIFLIFIVSALFIVNKTLTTILFILAAIIYILTSYRKSLTIKKEGRIAKISSLKKLKIIQETLGSMKNIILENNQDYFLKKYVFFNRKYLFAGAKISAELTKPKYFIEGIFISIIGTAAYLTKTQLDINPIPTLGSLALGFQKLLPAVNSFFISYSSMLGRYEQSCKTIDLITKTPKDLLNISKKDQVKLIFKSLNLKNISYTYPNSNSLVLDKCNLTISRGETIGIKGKTGSGKSTLINLIMGLIRPSSGEIIVNDIDISNINNEKTLIKWRKSISHVPQFIYLSDTSIIENIAFGENIKDINYEKVVYACKAARIYDFVQNSDKGLYTRVGERGIKLSGGQLQRIGIARALYKSCEILILDEATSALDKKTELEVIESLRKYSINLTIIAISHRLSTLVGYDRVISFADQKVYDEE